MILIIFVSALHAHTERDKTHAGKVSSQNSSEKKNERRKATNTTNEDE